MTPILRPHAVCDAREPICPRSSADGRVHVLIGRTTFRPDGSITTCLHREGGDTCGQRAVVLASHGDIVTVIGVSVMEADHLIDSDAPLKDGLRELEILIGRVA